MLGGSLTCSNPMPFTLSHNKRRSCCRCLRNGFFSNISRWLTRGNQKTGHGRWSGSRKPSSQREVLKTSDVERSVETTGGVSWLIVGLGNIGPLYKNTRHNVGFMVIDELARQLDVPMNKHKHKATIGFGVIEDSPVLLMKPITFMNNSGEAVLAASSYHKVPLKRVLVVYDDLDMETANVRLRGKGGHGGHNGMRSILSSMNGSEFPRIKVGIGRPSGSQSIVNYVLEPFGSEEVDLIESSIQETIDRIRAVIGLGVEKALSGVTLKSLNRASKSR